MRASQSDLSLAAGIRCASKFISAESPAAPRRDVIRQSLRQIPNTYTSRIIARLSRIQSDPKAARADWPGLARIFSRVRRHGTARVVAASDLARTHSTAPPTTRTTLPRGVVLVAEGNMPNCQGVPLGYTCSRAFPQPSVCRYAHRSILRALRPPRRLTFPRKRLWQLDPV